MIPRRLATSIATDLLSSIAFIAIRRVVRSILRGLPPNLPRARAEARPALVSSRSNSASEANFRIKTKHHSSVLDPINSTDSLGELSAEP